MLHGMIQFAEYPILILDPKQAECFSKGPSPDDFNAYLSQIHLLLNAAMVIGAVSLAIWLLLRFRHQRMALRLLPLSILPILLALLVGFGLHPNTCGWPRIIHYVTRSGASLTFVALVDLIIASAGLTILALSIIRQKRISK